MAWVVTKVTCCFPKWEQAPPLRTALASERQNFLSVLDEKTLADRLNFKDIAGRPYAEPLVQLMQHLVNHGTYHRGQITTMLRQIDAEAAALDMLYFFREQAQASG